MLSYFHSTDKKEWVILDHMPVVVELTLKAITLDPMLLLPEHPFLQGKRLSEVKVEYMKAHIK